MPLQGTHTQGGMQRRRGALFTAAGRCERGIFLFFYCEGGRAMSRAMRWERRPGRAARRAALEEAGIISPERNLLRSCIEGEQRALSIRVIIVSP